MTSTAKTAIVTGGSRGLGRALATALADAGWDVVIDGRDAEAVGAVPGVRGVPGDVSDPVHRQALIASVDRLDLLVNNASVLGLAQRPLGQYPVDVVRDVYEVNVLAPLALIQLALPMLRSSGGRIINVTSDAGVEPYEGWGGYGSSKAALDQLSAILGAEEPGVRVWAFDPGDMRTQMHQEAFPGEDISDRPGPDTVVPSLLALIDSDRPSGRETR